MKYLLCIFSLIVVVLSSSSCQTSGSSGVHNTSQSTPVTDNRGLINPLKTNSEHSAAINNLTEIHEDVLGDDRKKFPLLVKFKGAHIKAFLVAYEAFKTQAEIPESKKSLENYKISIHEHDEKYYVQFLPQSTDSEVYDKGGETSLGKEVVYILTKYDNKIIRFYFSE